MSGDTWKEQYRRANQWGKGRLAFVDRPLIGSPGAPAQAETNASNIWGHINAGYLVGYEYTRWWHESWALRHAAIVGDWSWLNKTLVTGRDAERFMRYASVKDVGPQQVGQVLYTPMANEDGKVAVEGLTLKLAEGRYLFTQSAGMQWLAKLRAATGMAVELEDVTADYTCFALQGPRSTDVLEAVTGEHFRDLKFSRWRTCRLLDADVIVSRQGVTGEVGYEFLMPTAAGNAHELWRRIREVGADFGLRELGFKAQMVGHTETGIATVIRDFLPARMAPEAIRKFAAHWMSREELDAIDYDLAEHFCSPAELGWAHTVGFDDHRFLGREALLREAEAGGPVRRLFGLVWNGDDLAELYAAQFRDAPAPPPPDLPYGQFRIFFLKVLQGGEQVGWASGWAYSPTLRRMISLARVRKDLAPGTELRVVWGGFSSEPSCEIRATLAALPLIEQKRRAELAPAPR